MLPNLLNYEITNLALWQGRHDSLPEERFFQRVQCIDIHTHSFDNTQQQPMIVGFCSDEGIRRNEGRTGARTGPDNIREQLAKLACHTNTTYLDAGNIVCEDEKLEAAQLELAKLIEYCHRQGHRTIVLGGGHEIAWGHFCGLAARYPKLGIINFDAHFDIRPVHQIRLGTSGTPFWQIKHYCQQHERSFDYCCLGIQEAANTKSLFELAHEWGIAYLTVDQLQTQDHNEKIAFLDAFLTHHEHIYLTICLDVFAECYAPGVSAPQALGLAPQTALPLLKYIMQTGKVVSLDLAELSPPLDQGHKTSRLAASMLAQLLSVNNHKEPS